MARVRRSVMKAIRAWRGARQPGAYDACARLGRVDKVGVTGSSPAPPIEKVPQTRVSRLRHRGDDRLRLARIRVATVFGRCGRHDLSRRRRQS
jgi:hypothetical protein